MKVFFPCARGSATDVDVRMNAGYLLVGPRDLLLEFIHRPIGDEIYGAATETAASHSRAKNAAMQSGVVRDQKERSV